MATRICALFVTALVAHAFFAEGLHYAHFPPHIEPRVPERVVFYQSTHVDESKSASLVVSTA
jgi:hypothetical protein